MDGGNAAVAAFLKGYNSGVAAHPDRGTVPGEVTKPPVEEPPPIELFDPTTLEGLDIPPRRWVVRDWIPWGYVTALYGDGATGKTLLAQMLSTAAATGNRWLGLETAGPLKVMALLCEDDRDELHRRQADINRLYGCSFADLGNIRWGERLGQDNLMMTFDYSGNGCLTPMYYRTLRAAKEFGAQLLIVDTAADTFGGNENIRPQVRQFVQVALGGFARAIGGSVMLCAHPSVTGIASGSGTGGSTAWNNTVRSRLYLDRPKPEEGADADANERVLSRKKANYAEPDGTISLRWCAGVFEIDGEAITGATPGMTGGIVRRKAERVFLELLDKLETEGRYVSENTHSPNYAPKVFASRPERDGIRKADFKGAMERLFSEGRIEIATYTRNRHEYPRIARKDAK
jgi:RecA-family ATPase